jgi:hypothetical protein
VLGNSSNQHEPNRVISSILTLSDLGPKLSSAKVAYQPATEALLGPQDSIHDCAKHCLEWDVLLAHEECLVCDLALLNEEQLAQDLVLASEVHIERSPSQADALGDCCNLGSSEALFFELLDGLAEQPSSSGLTLGRAPVSASGSRGAVGFAGAAGFAGAICFADSLC